jgi:hypothetical protein
LYRTRNDMVLDVGNDLRHMVNANEVCVFARNLFKWRHNDGRLGHVELVNIIDNFRSFLTNE